MNEDKCIFCKHTMKENQCLNCNAKLIIIESNILSSKNKNFNEYNEISKIIASKIEVDEKLIKKLVYLNLIQKLTPDIIIIHDVWRDKIFYKENIQLMDNYKQTKEYIFGTYIIKNSDYKIKYFRQKSLNYVINETNDFKIILYVNMEDKIKCILAYNFEYAIPYDVSMLNKQESSDLKYMLINQKHEIKDLPIKIEDFYGFLYEVDLDVNNELEKELKEIDIKISNLYTSFKNKMDIFKENNKSFFERALTEKEINNF